MVKCPRCGSPNAPLSEVRERSIDLVLVDLRCFDCGFSWSAVMCYVPSLSMNSLKALDEKHKRCSFPRRWRLSLDGSALILE